MSYNIALTTFFSTQLITCLTNLGFPFSVLSSLIPDSSSNDASLVLMFFPLVIVFFESVWSDRISQVDIDSDIHLFYFASKNLLEIGPRSWCCHRVSYSHRYLYLSILFLSNYFWSTGRTYVNSSKARRLLHYVMV